TSTNDNAATTAAPSLIALPRERRRTLMETSGRLFFVVLPQVYLPAIRQDEPKGVPKVRAILCKRDNGSIGLPHLEHVLAGDPDLAEPVWTTSRNIPGTHFAGLRFLYS